MKNIRFWAYTSAFLSLAISLAMVGLWISGVWELKVVNLNTFVGVIVSLLAIIVTLAIAWQIYNAVDMKKKVEELKQLEDRLKEQEKSLEQMKFSSSARINRLTGITAFHAHQMTHAFRFMLASLRDELQLEKPKEVNYLLNMMRTIVDRITPETKYKSNLYESIIKSNEKIQSLDNYEIMRSRYEYIFDKFISKVEKKEE